MLAVLTQPDAPVGRGYALTPSPVAQSVQTHGAHLYRPMTLGDPALLAELQSVQPDLGVVVAYGKLLPPQILQLPRYGCVNVHFSLLPKYRGAAPIAWALIQGETVTGVTTFRMEPTLDSGPILCQRSLVIGANDHAISLEQRLVALGMEVLEETVRLVEQGKGQGRPQAGEPTWAPKLTPAVAQIDWKKPATAVVNLIRGLRAGPPAFAWVPQGPESFKRLRILTAKLGCVDDTERSQISPISVPGQVVRLEPRVGFVVQCHQSAVTIQQVQPEGKPMMSAWDFWQGARLPLGIVFPAREAVP